MNAAAGWIAPIATMIAAMMTAANLGARLTGWGFVVFTIGSVAWTIVGVSSDQTNLIAANAFLTLVNVVGVWRWLGREARYSDDAKTVARASETAPAPTLTALSEIIGKPVEQVDGTSLATVVDVMAACDDGRLGGLLVRYGGVAGAGERVVMLEASTYSLGPHRIKTHLSSADLDSLPEAKDV